MLVDSHCHLDCLDLERHAGELDAALSAARQHDVSYMLCVCIDLENFPKVLAVAEANDDIWASVGVHPNHREGLDPSVGQLLELANNPKIVAIGETGLDYFRSQDDDMDWQRQRFCRHIEAAKQTKKPLIIHMRDAAEDTLRIMREQQAHEIGGVMHCFTETWDVAKQALDENFYISISGIVTFKSATQIQEVAKQVPLDRLLIETDAPYLAPVPNRGKPNEPAYLHHTAEFIAQLRGIEYAELAEQTTKNFFSLFSGASGA